MRNPARSGVFSPPVRRYHLSSAVLTPEQLARAVRSHWAVKTPPHRVLDVTFDEDHAHPRKDNGPENLALLRRLALNILQKSRKDISIARKCKSAGWSDDFVRSVIGQMR